MKAFVDVCAWRVQQNLPCFFVTFTNEEGQRDYKFFAIRFMAEDFKNSKNSKNPPSGH